MQRISNLRRIPLIGLFCAMLYGPCLTLHAREMPAAPEVHSGMEISARLTGLQDGDSFVAQTDQGKLTVRLAGVDAPERFQPHAANARSALQKLLEGKALRIKVIKTDQYQRVVAQVRAQHGKEWLDVGLEQLNLGLAWHYKRYAKEQDFDTRLAYTRAEEKARELRLGLWKDLDSNSPPQAPWDYRKARR